MPASAGSSERVTMEPVSASGGLGDAHPSAPLFERRMPDQAADRPKVAGFEIEMLLGRGAMAEVWRARQLGRLSRTVAIKLVRRDCLDAERLRRFETEARAMSAVDDPRIVRPFEVGTAEDGRPYIAMEYIDGVPLAAGGTLASLDLRARVRLVIALLDAVQSLHDRGILHRDLKPGNVLVMSGNRGHEVRLIDLGLAKSLVPIGESVTVDGALIGTPEFMSPEQAGTLDAPVSARSDVFSIGVMLYALVECVMPWTARRAETAGSRAAAYQQLLQSMRHEPPRPCVSCDAELAQVIRSAIDADPASRTPSARELRVRLEQWLAQPDGRPYRTGRWPHMVVLLGAIAAALSLALLVPTRGTVPTEGGWRQTTLAWIVDSHGLVVGVPGSGSVRLVAPAWRNPRGLDIDRERGIAYWTDYAGRIERVRLDGSDRQAIGAYAKVCGIDVSDGMVLWTCYGESPCIWFATEEGTDPKHITSKVRSPTGIRAVGDGSYLFSDWESNGVYRVRRGSEPERIAFVDGVYGIDYRERWVYYGDRTTSRILATNIDDGRTVVLVDDEAVGPVWQVVVSSRGDRVWWTRQQPHRAICTAPVSLVASQPAKVEAAFELGRDAWGLAIVEEP
jgi:tRNA A-37 threonylcarbamoyl transferase component Bud32